MNVIGHNIKETWEHWPIWQCEWILEKLKKIKPTTILLVGFGLSRILKFLSENLPYMNYTGVDLSHSMLEKARDYQSKNSSLSLLNASAMQLPFPDASFDVVLVHGVFMHIPPTQVEDVIREVKRITKSHILVCEQNYNGLQPKSDGNVQINDFKFAYDYKNRFQRENLLLLEQQSIKDLDSFLLKKRVGKYDVPDQIELTKLSPHDAHAIILRQIPSDSSILDVGCATGYLGRYLVEKNGCTVDGIEYDFEAGKIAQKYYRKVWVGSAEDDELVSKIHECYDVVMCPAILEHLVHPDLVLKHFHRFIKPSGFLLVSLPNTAHWSLRWGLLCGRWDYTEYGLLDRTHLRFYTLKTAKKLIENADYRIKHVAWSNVGVGPLEYILRWLPKGKYRLRQWLINRFPTLFGYELIFKAEVHDNNNF